MNSKKRSKNYNRYTTVIHDISEALLDKFPSHNIVDLEDFKKTNKCIYCDELKKKLQKDHLNSPIKDSQISILYNTSNIWVPCCKSCNPKKGNSIWRDFINKHNFYNNITILEKIDEYINTNKKELKNVELLNNTNKNLMIIKENITNLCNNIKNSPIEFENNIDNLVNNFTNLTT